MEDQGDLGLLARTLYNFNECIDELVSQVDGQRVDNLLEVFKHTRHVADEVDTFAFDVPFSVVLLTKGELQIMVVILTEQLEEP